MVPLADDLPEVVERLERVFGIYSMSPVMKVTKDLDAICEGAYPVSYTHLDVYKRQVLVKPSVKVNWPKIRYF